MEHTACNRWRVGSRVAVETTANFIPGAQRIGVDTCGIVIESDVSSLSGPKFQRLDSSTINHPLAAGIKGFQLGG